MTAAQDLQLRAPGEVMRLGRMGSSFPTRLSFMRTLIRLLADQRATVDRAMWDLDDDGFGRAVYCVEIGGYTYSLVAFSTPLAPEDRTDRVIAEAWDSSFVLFDGVPDVDDLDRLSTAAPRQEAARYLPADLTLSRANRSVRLFEHVVESLAAGHQPDAGLIGSIGYLMRTTAVYGNGKFGISDRSNYAHRPAMDAPFRAEMLTVWLIRNFTHDLVEHIAARRSPSTAVRLDRATKRHLGIGNATGLGMAPFLVNHPVLVHNWMTARETALARVRALETIDGPTGARVRALVRRARRHVGQWNVDDDAQTARIETLRDELAELSDHLDDGLLEERFPWDRLIRTSARWSIEMQELLVALAIEPHGDVVDDLADTMSTSHEAAIDPSMTVGELRGLIADEWRWALDLDFASTSETAHFWYVSEEKLEPRLGLRYEEAGAELEQPLDIARRVASLERRLRSEDPNTPAAVFLATAPEHRSAVLRVTTLAGHAYAEIRDNLIAHRCLPIDMLRCKLAFFGAAKFDPKSDRWTRITLFQGAPLADELDGHTSDLDADDWWLPAQPTEDEGAAP